MAPAVAACVLLACGGDQRSLATDGNGSALLVEPSAPKPPPPNSCTPKNVKTWCKTNAELCVGDAGSQYCIHNYDLGIATSDTHGVAECLRKVCVPVQRTCTPLPSNAADGYQLWNGSDWGACTITSCATGSELVDNACVPTYRWDVMCSVYATGPGTAATPPLTCDAAHVNQVIITTGGATPTYPSTWNAYNNSWHELSDITCGGSAGWLAWKCVAAN